MAEKKQGELSTGYHNLIESFAESYWHEGITKPQLNIILELFLHRVAAPDMYEALRQLVVDYSALCRRSPNNTLLKARLDMAQKALAKAEGKEG